jgi:hypothetical protein
LIKLILCAFSTYILMILLQYCGKRVRGSSEAACVWDSGPARGGTRAQGPQILQQAHHRHWQWLTPED